MSLFSKKTKLPISSDTFISIIGGTQSGIATTAAIVAGLVIGTNDRQIVVASAMVAVFIQAFNSALTKTVTEKVDEELEDRRRRVTLFKPIAKSSIQFTAHIVAGVLVILPILYVIDLAYALLCSIVLAVLMLFWIGYYVGHFIHKAPFRHALESFVTGVLIITGGILAGLLIN